MTRPAPACMTCREKCRRCDRTRPECQRCVSKGLVCRGYPEQFRFCGIASRGKWKGARIPASDRDLRALENPPEKQQNASGELTPTATTTAVSRRSNRQRKGDVSAQPIPDAGDNITTILSSSQTRALLDHYDRILCPHQIAEVGDDADNPYRAYILPLARKQIGLLYAVLGFSAVHLGKLTEDKTLHEAAAVEYRMKAIRALGELIRHSQNAPLSEDEQDAVFATIQLLLLHDIAESGISDHGIHITGAMSVCKSMPIVEGLDGRRQRAVFFLGNLAWLDIIRAFAGAERLCFTQDVREMVASAGGYSFELVNGCPREIFLIIGGALDKAKEYILGWASWDEYRTALLIAKHKLYSWDPEDKTYPSSDPRWLCVAEAFQYACILHILRLLNPEQPANDPDIQVAVSKILDATARIPSDCTLLELLIFPLFMAGADSLFSHSQYYILVRFREIERRSEVRNPVPSDLLKKVWAARAAQGPDDAGNISWTIFTRSPELSRPHDYLII